jgi:hypothetical protein
MMPFPIVAPEVPRLMITIANPPYLGNRKLKSAYGLKFLNWVRYEFAPAGSVDLVTYFL